MLWNNVIVIYITRMLGIGKEVLQEVEREEGKEGKVADRREEVEIFPSRRLREIRYHTSMS